MLNFEWSIFSGLAPRCRHRVSVRPKVPGPPPTAQDRQKLTAFLHFSTPAGGKQKYPISDPKILFFLIIEKFNWS